MSVCYCAFSFFRRTFSSLFNSCYCFCGRCSNSRVVHTTHKRSRYLSVSFIDCGDKTCSFLFERERFLFANTRKFAFNLYTLAPMFVNCRLSSIPRLILNCHMKQFTSIKLLGFVSFHFIPFYLRCLEKNETKRNQTNVQNDTM